MVGLTAITCPKCSANLEIEPGRNQCFCTYCGAKIILQNENEYVIRTIDEARIREAELNAELQNRILDSQEKKGEASRLFFKKRLLIYVIITAIGYFLGLAIGMYKSLGMAFLMVGAIGLMCVMYGSIIHGILLHKSKKK